MLLHNEKTLKIVGTDVPGGPRYYGVMSDDTLRVIMILASPKVMSACGTFSLNIAVGEGPTGAAASRSEVCLRQVKLLRSEVVPSAQ